MARVCCPLVGRLQAAAGRLGGHDLQPQSADSGGQWQAVGGGQSAGAAAPESAAARQNRARLQLHTGTVCTCTSTSDLIMATL